MGKDWKDIYRNALFEEVRLPAGGTVIALYWNATTPSEIHDRVQKYGLEFWTGHDGDQRSISFEAKFFERVRSESGGEEVQVLLKHMDETSISEPAVLLDFIYDCMRYIGAEFYIGRGDSLGDAMRDARNNVLGLLRSEV